MIKLFVGAVYKIFFMIGILWIALACATLEVGGDLKGAGMLGLVGLVCILTSILVHSFLDDPRTRRKKK